MEAKSAGTKLAQCYELWIRGAGYLLLIVAIMFISALPLVFLANLIGELVGRHVDFMGWMWLSALIFGPYYVGHFFGWRG